jgi:hypothetical protein
VSESAPKPESFRFAARCKDCGRLLGEIELPHEHVACGVIFTTVCRTSTCRERMIAIRFDQAVTATARIVGY